MMSNRYRIEKTLKEFSKPAHWIHRAHALLHTLVSVAVSAMFKALLRTPKEAAGAKAAAEPIKRDVTASFIFAIGLFRFPLQIMRDKVVTKPSNRGQRGENEAASVLFQRAYVTTPRFLGGKHRRENFATLGSYGTTSHLFWLM